MSLEKNGRLKLMCRKTELCRFYQKGACKRGSECDFAHKEEDVRAKPDLQRTKPCPTIAYGRLCEDPSCPFAHRAGELRRFKPHTLAVDEDVVARTKKRSGRAVRAENFLSNCSTATSRSVGQASPHASTDCTGSLNFNLDVGKGSIKPSLDKTTADAGWSRQTTSCSDSGFSRQISDSSFGRQISDSGFGRQISDGRQLSACSEGEQSPGRRRKHKTRMCSFYMAGTCRKDECNFAHGAHELNSRTGSKESVCSRGGRSPERVPAVPPQFWPPSPTGSTSSGEEPDSPGQQPSSSEDGEWASIMAAELEAHPGQAASHQPCPDEDPTEQECRLIVQNTFLTLVGSGTPKELRRSSSAPPGK